MLACKESNCVDYLLKHIDMLEMWLKEQSTEPQLHMALVRCTGGRGGVTMLTAAYHMGSVFGQLSHLKDIIGLRKLMEGVISKEGVEIQ